MTYGYRWDAKAGRYFVGGGDKDCFVKQVSEMQPRGHWVVNGQHVFFQATPLRYEPSLLERLLKWRKGYRWHRYSTTRQPLPNLGDIEMTVGEIKVERGYTFHQKTPGSQC